VFGHFYLYILKFFSVYYNMANFYNSLSSVACPEILDELNYNHSDDLNQMLADNDHSTDISIFHMNICSLNKNKAKLHNFLST